MIIKVVIIFLLVMAGLAIWGRMAQARRGRFCAGCGRPLAAAARGRCPCGG